MAKPTRICSLCARRLAMGSYSQRQWKMDSLSRKCEDCSQPGPKLKPKEDYTTTVAREAPPLQRLKPSKRSEEEVILDLSRALQAGLDVNKLNRAGLTVLMVAARGGDAEVVNWLLAHATGLDLDVRSPQNESAIMLAARHVDNTQAQNIVLTLASRGADVSGVNGCAEILTCGTEVYMLSVFEMFMGARSVLRYRLLPPLIAICVDYLDLRVRLGITRTSKVWRKLTETAQLHIAEAYGL